MNNLTKQNNFRDFKATCSNTEPIETPKAFYKVVNMFGIKTLIYWKHNGRISTRIGQNLKNLS